MPRTLALPDWATLLGKGRIEVDAEQFYPEILKELGIEDAKIDQYWLEVAKNVMKMDIRMAVAGTDQNAEDGGALVIHVKDGSKGPGPSKWAQDGRPEGEGTVKGARDTREIYRKLRGIVAS